MALKPLRLAGIVEAVVRSCAANAVAVVCGVLALGIVAGWYAGAHFALNSNSENLISQDLPWRHDEAVFDAAFPQQNNLTVVVVDGVTPERAERAAALLTAAMQKDSVHFAGVRRPDGGPFFARNGMLFLPAAEVRAATEQLIAAQPLLGAMAADPSLRGIMTSLSAAMLGVQHGDTNLAMLAKPMAAFADTLNSVLAGMPQALSWRGLMTGAPMSTRESRRFIEAQTKLDYFALQPGGAAARAIRADAEELHLTPSNGMRIRITGPVPMADEEFASIADRAGLMGALMMAGVLIMLWLALRSWRLILAVLVSLICGLAITSAFGLLALGTFNVISVAFIPLFVGLGVDFGIQFCVRYRAERHAIGDLQDALGRAGAHIGTALTLAAVAITAGFLSFLPTNYRGVAELGLIAGFGMLVTYALSITLLPALLRLLAPGGETVEIGYGALAPVDVGLARHAKIVVWGALGLAILCAATVPFLTFDANPLDLRDPKTESVATANDMMQDPETSPNAIEVLVGTRAEAVKLAGALSARPEVMGAVTVESFIPDDQQEKLAAIQDASLLLDTTLDPFDIKPKPSDAEIVQSLTGTAAALRMTAGTQAGEDADGARKLAGALERLAAASPAVRAEATATLIPDLQTLLSQTRDAMMAQPVSYETLPPDLVRDWVTNTGAFRVEALPGIDTRNTANLKRFTDAVRATAPHATGTPVIIEESGRTIVNAFIEAGIASLLSIAIILWLALRRVRDVLLALGPLVLAGLATLGTCAVFGLALNFANIIALPLLFGIGVAFDIYFVMSWRNGARALLSSPVARAVLWSAGTTGSAFGTLSISEHPGTASMGVLLLISLLWILVCVFFVLPAALSYFAAGEGLRERTPGVV